MVELFANSGDPDQMLSSVASDLGLHCLLITLLGFFRTCTITTYIIRKENYVLFFHKPMMFMLVMMMTGILPPFQHYLSHNKTTEG